MGTAKPRDGTQDDQAAARIADMDDEGVDSHFLIPTAWTSLVGHEDPTLETGVIRAYHRHGGFLRAVSGRLTSMIVAPRAIVDAAVKEIKEWGKSRWAVAVMPLVTNDMPADHPSLELTGAPPPNTTCWCATTALPGRRPIASRLRRSAGTNIFLGRLSSHPWGAMRFIASVIGGGVMDRYPNLRVGILECGFGWSNVRGRRMNEQYEYVGSTAKLKHHPEDYLKSGRFFCSVERGRGHVQRRHRLSR